MKLIQELFDSCGRELVLEPMAYKGPLLINRPCSVIGNGAVIVCGDSESVRIEAVQTELKNIRIERTSSAVGMSPVLHCLEDTRLNGVILRGDMICGNKLTSVSQYPDRIDLGLIPANSRNTVRISLNIAEDSVIENTISGVSVFPEKLTVGENEITVTVEPLRDEVTVFGSLIFKCGAGVGKEVCFSAAASKFCAECSETAALHFPKNAAAKFDNTEQCSVDTAPAEVIPPQISHENFQLLRRGQRMALGGEVRSVKLQLIADNIEKPMDIDGYAFLLHENGRTLIDEDMIFWGNTSSPENSVQIAGEGKSAHFAVDLGNVPQEIKKIAFCWSIYGDNAEECFIHVKSPKLRIVANDTNTYIFPMDGLMREKTIVAAEIYRYGDSWKIGCIGSGYHSGLKRLCEDYGVDIED